MRNNFDRDAIVTLKVVIESWKVAREKSATTLCIQAAGIRFCQ